MYVKFQIHLSGLKCSLKRQALKISNPTVESSIHSLTSDSCHLHPDREKQVLGARAVGNVPSKEVATSVPFIKHDLSKLLLTSFFTELYLQEAGPYS